MHYPVARLAAIASLAWSAAGAFAQTVTPPPLPPGSNLVRPSAGLNDDEKKRYVRAHHHKMHNKKDYTRDDTMPVVLNAGDAAGAPGAGSAASGNGAAAGGMGLGTGAQGGSGTGLTREKTDKGASSYFFGNNKK